MKNWKSIDIPTKMKDLPKDKNGYPIPYTIRKDEEDTPIFSQHDESLLHNCISNSHCGICGQPLGNDIWLLAGAKIALQPLGGYIDPPMHKQCGTYALQVCPYLALPSFLKRSPNEIAKSTDKVLVLSGKPSVFGFVKTSDYRLLLNDNGTIIIIPERPFLDIEYWREGELLTKSQAKHFL